MQQDNRSKAGLNSFSPLQTFIGGIIAGFLVLCTVGFFVMVSLYFKGDNSVGVRAGDNLELVANNDEQADNNEVKIDIEPVDETQDHIRGKKNAKITLIEYSDLECPYCKRFHETVNQVLDEYGDQVRLVFRHFPLDSLHAQARTEALATECAGEQGKFWELLDLIFARTKSNDSLDLDKLPDYAKEIGLNVKQFDTCLEAKKYAGKVEADQKSGEVAGAMKGVPYSVLIGPNGETKVINGAQPFSVVEAVIQEFL